MKLGTIAPHMGAGSTPEGMVQAAQQAEALGYESIWVAERLLFPLHPRTPYAATPDGSLPDFYRYVFTPLETLTFLAARTERIRIGTSVLNMPFHNPVVLGRQLMSLDVLSGGRLNVGLGQGWSEDEYEAAGASVKDRGGRADEFIEVLRTMWTMNPVEFRGKYFTIAPSVIDPKPVQTPHPPIYLAAFAPAALDRVARLADGWLPTGIPLAGIEQMYSQLRRSAETHGRSANAVKLVILGHVMVMDQAIPENRPDFVGTLDQIAADIASAQAMGADELILNPGSSPSVRSLDDFLSLAEQLYRLA